MIYDIAIIGGGPGGYSAAIRAAQQGKKTILFEYVRVGGTCLNVGCIPTKCLLDKAELIQKIREYTEYGIFKDAGLFSFKKMMKFKDETVLKLTTGIEYILKSYGVELINSKATLIKNGEIHCSGPEGADKTFQAKNIIIATGSKVINPPIDGIFGTNVIDSTAALSLTKLPQSMVIIGGGIIGLEFASLYATLGSKITVIEMLDSILPGEDLDGINLILNQLKKQGVKIITGAKVTSITDEKSGTGDENKRVRYSVGDQSCSVYAQYVLKAVGRIASKEGIDCAILGIELDAKGNILVNMKMETSVKGIYAIGDVAGGYQLAHSAYAEAEVAVDNCMGKEAELNVTFMPRCIYTMPQYAAAGMGEEELKRKGISYKKGVFPFAANGKALAQNENTGFSKVFTEEGTGRILGAVIAGHNATELLASMLTAMNGNVSIHTMETSIFPHPTMSEIIKETAAALNGNCTHLPKGKN